MSGTLVAYGHRIRMLYTPLRSVGERCPLCARMRGRYHHQLSAIARQSVSHLVTPLAYFVAVQVLVGYVGLGAPEVQGVIFAYSIELLLCMVKGVFGWAIALGAYD